jgi:hypothetical protein
MWATGVFERCQCQIKFVIKKDKTFVYLVTIMYSAADYLEIFGECELGRQQEPSKNVFRTEMTIIFSFATHFSFFATTRCNNN